MEPDYRVWPTRVFYVTAKRAAERRRTGIGRTFSETAAPGISRGLRGRHMTKGHFVAVTLLNPT
jgi:hypothetical protein